MKWNLKKKAPDKFLNKFKELDPLLVQLLYNRGIKTNKQSKMFLEPDYEKHTENPFKMKGVKEAVSRIKKALQNKEKIAIYGDYDTDGVCAATILNIVFKKIGIKPEIYIPDRKQEGYGLNKKGLSCLKKENVDLIITVDCGVSDYNEVLEAKNKGMDLIITDHHLVPDKLPEAEVIINPKQDRCSYPTEYLSGAGVAFKLSQALIKEFPNNFNKGFSKWLLDLVALATVADLMPLNKENRVLVKYGLVVLPQTKWTGIKAMAEAANLDLKDTATANERTLGYIFGPRLNAAGRMDHANLAFELLNTQDYKKALKVAKKLETKNNERQSLQKEIEKKIIKKLEAKEKMKFIFEGDSEWPVGIVGLIAGRICDYYYFPACIYSKGKKTTKGSCRSVKQINIVDILTDCSDYLEEFGGHSQAAGFTIKTGKLKQFEQCLRKKFGKKFKKVDLVPELEIEAELQPHQISIKMEKALKKLAPFGKGNPEPLFLTRRWEIRGKRKVGKNGNHLKLTLKAPLERGFKYIDALYFGWDKTDSDRKIEQGKKYDIVFEPMIDVWRGKKKLSLKIVDFKESEL